MVVPGYSRQNITFCITLKANGELVDITDERDATGKKAVAKKIQVLGGGKPPRSFEDYASLISIDRKDLPEGIEIVEPF